MSRGRSLGICQYCGGVDDMADPGGAFIEVSHGPSGHDVRIDGMPEEEYLHICPEMHTPESYDETCLESIV